MNHDVNSIFNRQTLVNSLESSDEVLLIELLEEFLVQLAELEATILIASNSGNYKELRRQCHKIKSSAKVVGSIRLSECIEYMSRAIAENSSELRSILTITELIIDRTEAAIKAELDSLLKK